MTTVKINDAGLVKCIPTLGACEGGRPMEVSVPQIQQGKTSFAQFKFISEVDGTVKADGFEGLNGAIEIDPSLVFNGKRLHA